MSEDLINLNITKKRYTNIMNACKWYQKNKDSTLDVGKIKNFLQSAKPVRADSRIATHHALDLIPLFHYHTRTLHLIKLNERQSHKLVKIIKAYLKVLNKKSDAEKKFCHMFLNASKNLNKDLDKGIMPKFPNLHLAKAVNMKIGRRADLSLVRDLLTISPNTRKLVSIIQNCKIENELPVIDSPVEFGFYFSLNDNFDYLHENASIYIESLSALFDNLHKNYMTHDKCHTANNIKIDNYYNNLEDKGVSQDEAILVHVVSQSYENLNTPEIPIGTIHKGDLKYLVPLFKTVTTYSPYTKSFNICDKYSKYLIKHHKYDVLGNEVKYRDDQ